MIANSSRRFCVFILSAGRPDNVHTVKTLERCGYSGDWYIVCGTDDAKLEEYRRKYGEKIMVFDKDDIAREYDEGDLAEDRRTVFYARNACFGIAKGLGYDCFVELDDDYTSFQHRYVENGRLKVVETRNLDSIFKAFVEWLYGCDALTVAMAQGGDFIGGSKSGRYREDCIRKAMNSFFCRTDRPVRFVGRVNEDVNTYTTLGMRGELLLTTTRFMLTQVQTQASAGGMTDVYEDGGTYLKSFFTVMYAPSCTTVRVMGDKHMRLHHHVKSDNAYPKIISADYRARTVG